MYVRQEATLGDWADENLVREGGFEGGDLEHSEKPAKEREPSPQKDILS